MARTYDSLRGRAVVPVRIEPLEKSGARNEPWAKPGVPLAFFDSPIFEQFLDRHGEVARDDLLFAWSALDGRGLEAAMVEVSFPGQPEDEAMALLYPFGVDAPTIVVNDPERTQPQPVMFEFVMEMLKTGLIAIASERSNRMTAFEIDAENDQEPVWLMLRRYGIERPSRFYDRLVQPRWKTVGEGLASPR
jgi:hypothetical protein